VRKTKLKTCDWAAGTRARQYRSLMSVDDMVDAYAVTGHRPTWRLGENSWATSKTGRRPASGGFRHNVHRRDPFGFFEDAAERPSTAPVRTLRNAERKALHSLGLEEGATAEAVKTRYKSLVKRLHPDANGGSRDSEDKLKEVIQAYDYLRSSGFC
jgi:hypothetical protein